MDEKNLWKPISATLQKKNFFFLAHIKSRTGEKMSKNFLHNFDFPKNFDFIISQCQHFVAKFQLLMSQFLLFISKFFTFNISFV